MNLETKTKTDSTTTINQLKTALANNTSKEYPVLQIQIRKDHN